MNAICRKVAALWLVALCSLGHQIAMADEPKAMVKSVSGAVHSSVDDKPIPALVYVNGKSVFADKTTGAFTLTGNPLVPPLPVGQTLTLRVLAKGYAPILKRLTVTSAQLTNGKFSELEIAMKPVVPGKPLTVAATYRTGTENGFFVEDGFFVVSGTVSSGPTPVCAVVWANGSSMLACQTSAIGHYSLKGKLNASGKVNLKVFPVSSTYRTYAYTTPDTDNDGTADFMDRDDDNDGFEDGLDGCRLDSNPACKDTDRDGKPNTVDTDDDNDGVLDANDECPLNPVSSCAANSAITDTIFANGKVWAQVNLFKLSWDDINAVCPVTNAGACSGTLNGWDMNGWQWAAASELQALFNFYGFGPRRVYFEGAGKVRGIGKAAVLAWLGAGWEPTDSGEDWGLLFELFVGYTRDLHDARYGDVWGWQVQWTQVRLCGGAPSPCSFYETVPTLYGDEYEGHEMWDPFYVGPPRGGWFYKSP